MKTNFTIKNFKIFGDNEANIEFAPLTILTGCNSSGKSSIVKSILLLNSFMSGLKSDHELERPMKLSRNKLDFSLYPNNLLGRYSDVLNENATDNEIHFSYTIYSNMLGSNVTVELTFEPDPKDILDNGYIKKLIIRKEDEIIYSTGKNVENFINFTAIKQECFEFLQLQANVNNCSNLQTKYYALGGVSEEEFQTQTKHFKGINKLFPKKRLEDILHYMRFIKTGSIISIDTLKNDILNPYTRFGWILKIPIVEELATLPKEEVITKLKSLIESESNEISKKMLERIISDFENSEMETLGEYYSTKESAWLSKVPLCGTNLFSNSEPMLPSKYCINLGQTSYEGRPDKQCGMKDWDEAWGKEPSSRSYEQLLDEWYNQEITFDLVYSALMEISSLNGAPEDSNFYKYHDGRDYKIGFENYILKYISQFVSDFIEEIILPEWVGTLGYVSSSRVDIKRIYDLQNGNDFTHLLKSYFESIRTFNKKDTQGLFDFVKNEYEPNSFMNKWIDKFGIGKAIKLEMDTDGAGVKIRLVKYDGSEKLLADEGYGISQLASIILQIENAILSAKNKKADMSDNLCFLDGYDQNAFHYAEQTIAIEEPEIHLHPKFQSLLADMLTEAVTKYNIHFIVETHSEYLIRKLQLLTQEIEGKAISKDDIAIYYVDKAPIAHVRRIGICKNGYLDDEFGPGFFDEASSLARKLR